MEGRLKQGVHKQLLLVLEKHLAMLLLRFLFLLIDS